jgi:branched-chain amino acid transport system substrate-binding protein
MTVMKTIQRFAIERKAFPVARCWALKAVGVLAVVGIPLVANAFEQPGDGVYSDRIDWGLMMDMSGTASGSQIPWVQGVQAYMRKVNEAGGINGRKVNLLVEDDRYNASLTRINYEKLVNQTPVLGISGLGNSSGQVALMSTVRNGKVPIVGSYALTRAGVEPVTPMYYGGYCGFKEMAQVGIGYFNDTLKLKAPKVVTAHMDVAGGKEYAEYIAAEVAKLGGSSKALPIKIGAADVTSQVLEIIAMKPDVVTVYGVPSPTILLLRTMQQYGVKIPTFAITQLGTEEIYSAAGAEAGSNYYFVSCFTPGDNDDTLGVKEMAAYADKYGHSALKTNGNFVGGWVIGQLIAESIARTGPEPTRAKLVESMNKGFEVDTRGASAPLKYTALDHRGLIGLRPYSYDYTTKRFKAYGKFSDYDKYVK